MYASEWILIAPDINRVQQQIPNNNSSFKSWLIETIIYAGYERINYININPQYKAQIRHIIRLSRVNQKRTMLIKKV